MLTGDDIRKGLRKAVDINVLNRKQDLKNIKTLCGDNGLSKIFPDKKDVIDIACRIETLKSKNDIKQARENKKKIYKITKKSKKNNKVKS